MGPVQGLISAAVAVAAPSGPVMRTHPFEYREVVGDWEVKSFIAGRCSVVRAYATGTLVLVSSTSEGDAGLSVLNRAWLARDPGPYRLTLIQSGAPRSFAAEDDRAFNGLSRSAPNGARLLAQLAAGGVVEVAGSDGAMVERVDLGGIAPALARLGPCVTEIATAANFPPPAAPPPPPGPPLVIRGKARPARSQTSLHLLFSSDDYPAAAVRAGEEGAVGFRIDIGRDGRVVACAIVATSGSAILDSTTCRLVAERARFSPALDRKGRPTADSIAGRIVWRLPRPEPEPPPPS